MTERAPFAHQPAPRGDGRLPVTVTHLELAPADWTPRGRTPDLPVAIERIEKPTAALYLDLYDRVGRAWLWYERRLLAEAEHTTLLNRPDHELHVARHDSALVGYFELDADEIVFFGLAPDYLGRRIGPWLLDRAIERGFARGSSRLVLNTNSVDHPRALDTYRKAGFRVLRSESKELQDPRVLWPDIYRWPPKRAPCHSGFMTAKKTYTRPDTVLAVAGRDPANNFGIVNPPVYHASTILAPTMAKFENRIPFEGYGYGRNGTPTQKALEDAVAAIEGAHRSIAVQSGLGAVAGAIVGFFKTGDHFLLTDNCYGPARRFANTTLKGFGVETTFFDPMIGAGIETLIRPNTKAIYLEAPGSQTFEVQDVDAIAAVAKKHKLAVLIDNTWATPLYFKPFDHGCDISVHAGTKYIVGHSDAMMGIISCATREMFELVKTACMNFGFHAAPDDSYLALRGLRTMAVRLRHHEKSGLTVAHWLKERPEVDKVLHPALADCPGHDNWKRMFKGSSGLFSFTLRDGYSKGALAAMLDGMDIFGMGASWGGYESLLIPAHPDNYRTAVPWPKDKHILRVHIGLEDVEDLKTDLAEGFDRLNRAHNA